MKNLFPSLSFRMPLVYIPSKNRRRSRKKTMNIFNNVYCTKNTYVNVCNWFGNLSCSDRICYFLFCIFFGFDDLSDLKRDMQLFFGLWFQFHSNLVGGRIRSVNGGVFVSFWFCFLICVYDILDFHCFCFVEDRQPFTGVSTQQKKIYMRKKRKTKSFTVNQNV